MSANDKLTIEEVKAYIAYIDQECPSFNPNPLLPVRIAKQLADTMRENERLHDVLKEGVSIIEGSIKMQDEYTRKLLTL